MEGFGEWASEGRRRWALAGGAGVGMGVLAGEGEGEAEDGGAKRGVRGAGCVSVTVSCGGEVRECARVREGSVCSPGDGA